MHSSEWYGVISSEGYDFFGSFFHQGKNEHINKTVIFVLSDYMNRHYIKCQKTATQKIGLTYS